MKEKNGLEESKFAKNWLFLFLPKATTTIIKKNNSFYKMSNLYLFLLLSFTISNFILWNTIWQIAEKMCVKLCFLLFFALFFFVFSFILKTKTNLPKRLWDINLLLFFLLVREWKVKKKQRLFQLFFILNDWIFFTLN